MSFFNCMQRLKNIQRPNCRFTKWTWLLNKIIVYGLRFNIRKKVLKNLRIFLFNMYLNELDQCFF